MLCKDFANVCQVMRPHVTLFPQSLLANLSGFIYDGYFNSLSFLVLLATGLSNIHEKINRLHNEWIRK